MLSPTLESLSRPFDQLVGDALTRVVGGVVDAPIRYFAGVTDYTLPSPAEVVFAVEGRDTDGLYRRFAPVVDYELIADPSGTPIVGIRWTGRGATPADDTDFLVDFRPVPDSKTSRSPLTDVATGSVVRTLLEAAALLLFRHQEKLRAVYNSAYVDTATEGDLNRVVALLGLERLQPGIPTGTVAFFGTAGRTAAVRVPAGTGLVAPGGDRFVTTAAVELQASAASVEVPIRAESVGAVRAGEPMTVSRPVPGIREAVCRGPVREASDQPVAEPESDDALKARAKRYLSGVSGATAAAIRRAVTAVGGEVTDLTDPSSPTTPTPPGVFRIRVSAPPDKLDAVRGAVEATRAAGVRAEFGLGRVELRLRLRVPVRPDATGPADRLVRAVIDALTGVVNATPPGGAAMAAQLIAAVRAVDGVAAAPTFVDAVGERVDDAGGRLTTREMVRRADGDGPATDEDLEAGTFRVVAAVAGAPLPLLLTTAPTDVRLTGGAA